MLDGQWLSGVDSMLYPTDLAQGSYAWGVNVVNRSGVVQTRPGKRRVTSFCGRNAQGVFWCRTLDDQNYLLVAIDGYIYWAPAPFTSWTQIAGVTFSATAHRIYFANGIQAVQYDYMGNVTLLPNPKNIVFMQDGTSTPCYWDATTQLGGQVTTSWVTSGHPPDINGIQPASNPMPIGTAMVWQDNRMFVAVNNLVHASDLLHPQSFYDDATALATQGGFRFPRKVTNLMPAPVQGLLVLTDSSMHTLASYISNRQDWQTTQGFQSDVSIEVGAVGPWAVAYLHGMIWLYTHRGIISYDRALTQNLTTVILTQDGEMQRSKWLMAGDLSNICLGVWENILLVSVPASSTYNRHTWILDGGITEKLNNNAGMSWSGIWTGTHPVQYTSPIVNGTQHNYELSYSSGYLSLKAGESPSPMVDPDLPHQAYIHLFENFIPNQLDDVENPVSCSFETKAFTLTTDDYYRFVFAEFMLVNLKGIVPVQVYVCGLAGNYQPLFSTTLRADVGPWGNPTQASLYYVFQGQTTQFENYRRQVRHMRTQEFVVHESPGQAACVEIGRLDGIDKGFQLMMQWQGRLGVRMLKFFYDRQMQSPQGQCPVDESMSPHITLEATP